MYEYVEPGFFPKNLACKLPDRFLAGIVQQPEDHLIVVGELLDLCRCLLTFCWTPAGKDDPGPAAGKIQGRLETYSGIGTCKYQRLD